MKAKGMISLLLAGMLTSLEATLPSESACESVNWQVTVTANETFTTMDLRSSQMSASLSGMGGVQGYFPPSGTRRLDITIALRSSVCPLYGTVFYDIPLQHPYYSVLYTYLGGGNHKVEVFGGNLGGALLRQEEFNVYCPNGYRQMSVSFDAFVTTIKSEPRTATTQGTLIGELGETKTAQWRAEPQPANGGTLDSYQARVVGDNSRVGLSLVVNPDNVSGSVIAQFPVVPPCVPYAEVCDGRDNNCNGEVDENSGSLSCGFGVCSNTVAACQGGQPQTCTPLPPSPEVCDQIDNDCDGITDNNCPTGISKIMERFADDQTPPPGLPTAIENVNKASDKRQNR